VVVGGGLIESDNMGEICDDINSPWLSGATWGDKFDFRGVVLEQGDSTVSFLVFGFDVGSVEKLQTMSNSTLPLSENPVSQHHLRNNMQQNGRKFSLHPWITCELWCKICRRCP